MATEVGTDGSLTDPVPWVRYGPAQRRRKEKEKEGKEKKDERRKGEGE